MEFITTVSGIMTTQLYKWDVDKQSQDEVIAYAQEKSYDTVPVAKGDNIHGLFYVDKGEIKPITHDLLLTRDTPIPDALTLLCDSQHPALLVLYRQKIEGIITPSDFNKVLARSYFYNLLAQLEMLLAIHARKHYPKTDDIVALIKGDGDTVSQYRKTIEKRSKGAERNKLNLDLVHNLFLWELESLVRKDEDFREYLAFTDLPQVERLFEGINGDFRRKVMHPTRPLLSDGDGIKELNQYVHQVVELIDLFTTVLES